MSITSRPYADDLDKIQSVTAQWIAEAGLCGYLHIADIPMRLFNGMRRYAPQEIIRLWETDEGKLLGWAMVYPNWDSYEVALHPAFRDGDLAVEILAWAENETRRWMQQEGRGAQSIILNVYEDDASRIALLVQRSYQCAEQHSVIGQRSLDEPIPDLPLPDGFSIRPVADNSEIQKLIEVQNATFGWKSTADEYRRTLHPPAYSVENHLVVVAPDGHFAASCYLMLDTHNKIGMFENVGTHPDFQRMGLGRALLYDGMRRMKTAGMETVLVPYNLTIGAGRMLYKSVGFLPKYNIFDYTKPAS